MSRSTERSRASTRRPSRFGAFLVALTLASAPFATHVAHADTTAAAQAKAKTLFNEGLDLRKDGKSDAALAKFQEAFTLVPSPVIGLELARTLEAAGRLVEARAVVDEIAKTPLAAAETQKATDARMAAVELGLALDHRIVELRVKVTGTTEVPTVTLDGRTVSDWTSAPLKVDPGKHVLVATTSDGSRAEVSITVAEGEHKDVTLEIAGAAAAPVAPVVAAPAPAPEEKKAGGLPTGAWIGFGVAGAGIAVGTVTGILALSKGSSVKSSCNADNHCPSSVSDDLDASRRMGTISTIAFVVGGAGLAFGIVSLVTAKPQPSTTTGVTPWIGVASAGIRGSF